VSAQTPQDDQRRILPWVAGLNAALFVGLGVAGWLADSSALLGNAADNDSDSAVYPISFLAVGRAWPDLIVGALGAVVAIKGGLEILRDAARTDDNEEAVR
jgi:cobalt-zinc-cadmium efflux system protein